MPPHRTPPGSKLISLHLPLDLIERVKDLASNTRRSMTDEITHALERHLAAPPQVIYEMTTPPLAPDMVRVEKQKKRRR